jgi:enediyne polyketide synthase
MEKRISKRIPVSLEAHLTWSNITHRAFITDISEKGLYVIAPSGEKDFGDRDKNSVTVKFYAAPSELLELQCKEVWCDNNTSEHSTQTIGLEIQNPTPSYEKFYKAAYFRIKKDMSHDAIAVVGMACYYPDAPDLKSFWENILARRRSFRRIPEQRLPLSEYYDANPFAPDKTYGNRAAVIDGFEFDWVKRGIPKSVVESSDIVHWLALEVALRAMEDAGYSRGNTPSDRSGVILGNTLTGEHSRSQNMRLRWPYVKKVLKSAALKKRMPPDAIDELIDTMEGYYKAAFAPITEDTLAGHLSNTIAGRICNFLDLHGGGYTVDGACSSSLIALTTAANALSTGTLDLAVVGGIDISLDTFELVGFAKTNALTKTDMKVYDRSASGFIPGEGAGCVVLKRLQNARAHGNYIYAVMSGWGISSDGKGGMTAPKAQTQALAIRRAYGNAGYDLGDIDFIEGHGTGTIVGDKAELEGIATAMDEGDPSPLRSCGITSLKSLIGHTKAASGIGGFIKAVMAVNRRVIPPTAGFTDPNPVFQEKALKVYAVTQGEIRSADDVLRAGVSGMGFGGINCHVTIESSGEPAKHIEPSVGERELLASYQETELFVMSADSQLEMVERIKYLKVLAEGMSTGELVDLSRQLTRDTSDNQPFRMALIAGSPEDLLICLDRAEQMLVTNTIAKGELMFSPNRDISFGNSVSRTRIGFLFPGQGSQQLNMGRRLVERYSWARDLKDKAGTWLSESNYEKIDEFIYRPLDRALNDAQIAAWKEQLSRSEIAQPAICMTSLLWIRHLDHLGIKPFVAGGHSLGELPAFYAAGAFDDKSLIRFAAFRGKVMAAPDDNPGQMAVLGCGREKTEGLLREIEGYAVVANINSPMQTVISGERAAIEKAVKSGSLLNIRTKLLPVSNAFHSRFMIGAADKIHKHAPIPQSLKKTDAKLFTSMDGNEITLGTDLRMHFSKQVTHQVDYISLINNMRIECDLLFEVGPGSVLSDLVKSITATDKTVCLPIESKAGDDRSLNILLGSYFAHGGKINWPALFENRLVRPFIPSSERLFIDNPCERPLDISYDAADDKLVQREAPSTEDGSMIMDHTIGLFSKQQIDYIRGLVHAEIKMTEAGPKENAERSLKEMPAIPLARPSSTDQSGPSGLRDSIRNPDMLLQLASKTTGFPIDSISLDHRLLDNLNLDSIKAGIFVAKAIKLYGAEGILDPTSMANSSLREIHVRIESHLLTTQQAHESSDAQQDKPFEDAATKHHADNWVRNFKVVYKEQELASPYSSDDIIAVVASEKKQIVIVSDDDVDSLSSDMHAILTQKGVSAILTDYKSLSKCNLHDYEKCDYFVFLLPRGINAGMLTGGQVHDMATRMHCIGRVITSMKLQAEKPTHAVVQFGNGDFFKSDTNISLEAKGSAAFLCSIHLENPSEKIRILEFCTTDDTFHILQKITEELYADENFSIATFNGHFIRHVPALELIERETVKKRKINWTGEDVVLVTGGAKGITAECALAFALKTGVKLAVVGSTAMIENHEEIQNVLLRYRRDRITYRYYACDISDKASVADLKKRVEQDLGVITGVIHGAAINKPRRAEQVTLSEALSEIAPKLIGAINICECLNDNPPKLFIGFGSIIGVTGMAGNTWYGFSNETLNLLLQQFASSTATTETLTCAFSIWSEVGMGMRMGSMTLLSKMGILPIPKTKGTEHFMQLVEGEFGAGQVVVASRMGGMDTIQKTAFFKPRAARFLEEIIFYESGVEIETKVILTLSKDPYLKDHVFKGTHLFPTVFGIEAMAQAVAALTGRDNLDYIQMENVLLSYPISVEPDSATEIHIRAIVDDTPTKDKAIRVKAAITVDQTGFSKNHFEAMFVLQAQNSLEQYAGKLPEDFLDIQPGEDLYGHMLFQGSMFQRIKAIRSMHETYCVFDSEKALPDPSLNPSIGEFIAGDPFFRDTLLQSAQIILPDVVALPVEIENWKINLNNSEKGYFKVVVDSLRRTDTVITANVSSIDNEGRVVEMLHGYKGMILAEVQNAPTVEDLVSPDAWDELKINTRIQSLCQRFNMTPPEISVRHQSGFHAMNKRQRHQVEKELIEKAYRKLKVSTENLPDEIMVKWTETGKPVITGNDGVGVSCSHDERLCICVVGERQQGCDIEPITHITTEKWKALLGATRTSLFETIYGLDKSADVAGSRIWCALEALRKATDMKESDLKYDLQIDDCITFKGDTLTILTFPVKLLRGRERMVAIVVINKDSYEKEQWKTEKHAGNLESDANGKLVDGGPNGQRKFTCRFPLGLRENAAVGGGVYFANYFHWIGRMRERALKPIGTYIADEFSSGHFMVTNYSDTEIVGHIANHELVDASIWVDKMFGYEDSSLILHFEWRKLMPDGMLIPIAFSRHQVSWIKVIGHGVVEPVPCPQYFKNFLKDNGLLPKGNGKSFLEGSSVERKKPADRLGNILYEGDVLDIKDSVLGESFFDTTMEHSNLAQNVYFSNYFTWQGQLRDRYLFSLSPELYRKMNRHGRFACISSNVEHLREAMPFDRIAVTVKLKRVYERGMDLYFEYFKTDSLKENAKLAYGTHTLSWVHVDDSDNYVPQNLPKTYRTLILPAKHKNYKNMLTS